MRRASLIAFGAGCLLASRRRGGAARRARTVTLRGEPDGSRRPSDGIVAEASIVARLLRLRLLTLDATVVISPAVVTTPPSGPRPAAPRPAAPRPAVAPARDGSARARPALAPAGSIGRRLAQAARSVDESAATLAATRHAAGRAG